MKDLNDAIEMVADKIENMVEFVIIDEIPYFNITDEDAKVIREMCEPLVETISLGDLESLFHFLVDLDGYRVPGSDAKFEDLCVRVGNRLEKEQSEKELSEEDIEKVVEAIIRLTLKEGDDLPKV